MTTDKSIIEPFLKILALEEEQGYQDRAVAGGLDKLLHRWESDLSQIIGEFKSSGNPIKISTYKDENTRGDIPDLDEHREKILKEFI